ALKFPRTEQVVSWACGRPMGRFSSDSSGDGNSQNVTLACVTALNVSVGRPTGSAPFLQPTAIDIVNATGLSMQNVLLRTGCDSVLEYQEYFCSSHDVAGSIMLWRGSIHFMTWQDGFTSLRNVTLTCPSAGAAPEPPCWFTSVGNATELLNAFVSYMEAVAANVTIVLAADIAISNSPVPVGNHVQLVGSSRLNRPVLDFQLMVTLWDLLPAVSVGLINLTCVNLAPSYISPAFAAAAFSMVTHRVWAFRRYWIKYLVSPVPEDQAQAAWLNVSDMKILKVNDSGIYYDAVKAYTVTYSSVRLTDSFDGGYPLLPLSLGLQQLLEDGVPLSAVRQVMNMSDMLIALSPSTMQSDSKGYRWILLVANFSLTDVDLLPRPLPNAGANGGDAIIGVQGRVVVGVGTGLRAVRLDFGGRLNMLEVVGIDSSELVLRALVLGTLPARSAAYDPQSPLDVLVSPIWGVLMDDGTPGVVLENCTVLVSEAELRLLLQCLLPASTAPAPTFDAALMAAVKAFFTAVRIDSYNSSYLRLASGSTQRYSLTDVTFRMPVAAHGEVGLVSFVAPLRASPSSGGGGLEGGKVGVVVGCVVGGVVALAVGGAALLAVRRRRRRYAAEDDAARRDGAYAKYLRSGGADLREGAPGGPGGGVGPTGGSLDLANPSNDLTNSSQVLRPDARRSDLEASRLKATGSGTASGSASGGLGPTGRSTSITGVTSHDTSSCAVLPIGGGVGASAQVSAAAASSPSTSGDVRQRAVVPPPGSGSGSTAASAANVPAGHGASQGTDSFDRPPSNTALGQHGPASRHTHRVASVAGMSSVPSTSIVSQTQSVLGTTGSAALEQMHQMIQVLGRDFNDRQLEVHGMLGKGAHGTVYRGTWRGLPVAVKSMVFNSDSSARQQGRVLMEAAISSNLAHPNIVTTYSYELREVEHELASISQELARQGGGWRLLIIQEYCDAGPLRRLVDCGFFLTPPKPSGTRPKLKLPSVGLMRKDSPSGRPTSSLHAARRYVEAALMVARGLQHIHDKNIVHGDLNPNNVLLVRAPGTPLGFCLKVADFGLSVRMAEGESHMSNLFQGSPYYCAP
ncbi:hypothetical protein VOLCADRAFT_116621, partial [Volvox carteri f. nagariensis]